MKNKVYRQGDVLLVKTKKPTGSIKAVDPKNGRVILAYGESTGHHHSIASTHCQEWIDDAGVTWIEAKQAVQLLHQEHDVVPIARGWYKKIQQREYHPMETRRVAD